MEIINQEKLSILIQSYKSEFNKYIDQELYKWRAVAHFQKYWDIDAPDFKEMLNAALNFKEDNLLVGPKYLPKRMLNKFCEVDVDLVKKMFVNLFDENLDLAERINSFIASSDELINRYNPEKNHFQDYHAISTYLWLRFPDKYYIYKSSCVTSLVDKLGFDFKKKNKLKGQNVVNVYAIYNQIAETLNADKELQEMLKSSLTQDCYADPMSRTLAVDFGYYLQTYYKGNNSVESSNPKVWLYAPGEQARMWDECVEMQSIRLGWDYISNLLDFDDKKDIVKALQEANNNDSSFMNDSLALWQFAYGMNVGDVVYVKKGINKIIGRGIVESNYGYDESLTTYRHTRKVSWTHIGEWECLSERLNIKTLTDITKYPDFVNKLNDLVMGNKEMKTKTPSRWWLNANPKFWTLSGWKAGEEQNYTLYNANGNKRRIFQNFIDAKEGDTVICYESTPTKQILCLAEVSKANDGENIWFKKIESLNNPIDFAVIKNIPELQEMEYFVNPNGSFFKLTEDEYQILMEIVRENNPLISIDTLKKYSDSDFLNEVYITSEELQKLKSLLRNKQNIILQGAPGVGKTFTAERLAYTLMGVKDNSRIEMVQFHQNYSYEDFIMGYKPNEAGGFELKQGVFYKFCKKAANSPEKDFFFIIDEINRGNLSKIFGELLMLIENSYRGKEIKLAYTDELFTVPNNLYIIGMMNTADRSLAMIDYALRRRFSFFEMHPGFDSEGFKNYLATLSNEKLDLVIKQIQALNEVIRKDESLGQGFCIGHSYFCNQTEFSAEWLNNVIKYDIEPMLKEYWFDEVEKYNTQISILRNLLK